MEKWLIFSLILVVSISLASAGSQTFYESFDSMDSLIANKCIACTVSNFAPGLRGKSAYFTDGIPQIPLKYPVSGNIDKTVGTVSFWARQNYSDAGGGLFDYGSIGSPTPYFGIFENKVVYLEFTTSYNVTNPTGGQLHPAGYITTDDWTLITMTWQAKNVSSDFISLTSCVYGQCFTQRRNIDHFSFNPDENYFAVGWSGFYRLANSFIDEFKIFDYAKTESEIKAEYNSYLNFTITCTKDSDCPLGGWTENPFCSSSNVYQNKTTYACINPSTTKSYCYSQKNSTLKQQCASGCTNGACISVLKPQSVGNVTVFGRKLFVNGFEYKVKSVGYAPVPIGFSADWGYDVTQVKYIRDRDFPLIRNMGANTIRTWGKVGSKSFLDDAYNNGNRPLRVIMGYWMGSDKDYSSQAVRTQIIEDFKSYVTLYKDHPAVLVWAIGNEENHFYANGNNQKLADYISLVNEMARQAYLIEGSRYHPVVAVTLEMPGVVNTAGNPLANADDANTPFIDIWGINNYPGKTFGNYFNLYSSKTSKPLLITEYGVDALNNTSKKEYEDVQADWDVSLWKDIASSNIAIGGSLMEYSDEFWKDFTGAVNVHDYGGYNTQSQPEGYANEEWWGIVRVSLNQSGIDTVTPRSAYYALKQEFSGGIACYSNLDCDDKIWYTLDTCVNPGTVISRCVNTVVNCVTDSDCGVTGYISGGFCQGKDVYRNYQTSICTNKGTVNSYCSIDVNSNKVTDCPFVCAQGACVRCNADSDCFDFNSATVDVCLNPGTTSSSCKNQAYTITCFKDADCGTNKFTGQKSCNKKDVMQNFVFYSCFMPGTIYSYCNLNEVLSIRYTCTSTQYCLSGACYNRCTDPDKGNTKKKATVSLLVSGKIKKYTDYCANSKTLYEYDCSSSTKMVKKTIKCSCSKGRCK